MKNQRAALLTPSPAFSCGGRWGWGFRIARLAAPPPSPCPATERTSGKPAAAIRIVRSTAGCLRAIALGVALGALRLYRLLISPLLTAMLGPACRFEPTCSQYAHQALAQHGLGRGLYLTIRRLMRCRPLGGWGYDPVPAPAAHAARHRS